MKIRKLFAYFHLMQVSPAFTLLIYLFLFIHSLKSQELKTKIKNGFYGLVDGREVIVPFEYDTIYYEWKKYYVRKDGMWGVINNHGREMIPCQYDKVEAWFEGKFIVTKSGLQGIVDSTGGMVFNILYDEIDHTAGDSLALVMLNGKWALYKNGNYNYNADSFIFHQPDSLPTFPGCERNDYKNFNEFKKCSEELLFKYIFEKTRYPTEALNKGIQGTVVVQFTIDKNGYISKVIPVRKIGGGCDEESVRVISNMPRLNPGYEDGEIVVTQFVLPIKFTLR
jgi:TonB family protein